LWKSTSEKKKEGAGRKRVSQAIKKGRGAGKRKVEGETKVPQKEWVGKGRVVPEMGGRGASTRTKRSRGGVFERVGAA